MPNRCTDIQAIEKVLQQYIKGTATANGALINDIFHSNATMFGYMAGNLLDGGIQPFTAHLAKAGAPGDDYQASITGIEVCGATATASLVEDQLWGLHFVNQFHLVKTEQQWLIVAKLFHHD